MQHFKTIYNLIWCYEPTYQFSWMKRLSPSGVRATWLGFIDAICVDGTKVETKATCPKYLHSCKNTYFSCSHISPRFFVLHFSASVGSRALISTLCYNNTQYVSICSLARVRLIRWQHELVVNEKYTWQCLPPYVPFSLVCARLVRARTSVRFRLRASDDPVATPGHYPALSINVSWNHQITWFPLTFVLFVFNHSTQAFRRNNRPLLQIGRRTLTKLSLRIHRERVSPRSSARSLDRIHMPSHVLSARIFPSARTYVSSFFRNDVLRASIKRARQKHAEWRCLIPWHIRMQNKATPDIIKE